MAKFGDIISSDVPVLLQFHEGSYDDTSPDVSLNMRELANMVGESLRIIKIDVEKNPKLAQVLSIKNLPTYMVYQNKEMKWRQSGALTLSSLLDNLKKYM